LNEGLEDEIYQDWEIIYAPDHMQSFEQMKEYLLTCEGRSEHPLTDEEKAQSLFEGGWRNSTPLAKAICDEFGIDPKSLFLRHLRKDYGRIPDEDAMANDYDLENGGHVLSRYRIGDYDLYVETDGSRLYSTLMEVWER
jgi:hypothetical protein